MEGQTQDSDGPGEDGPDGDVHAMLEALRALRLYGQF